MIRRAVLAAVVLVAGAALWLAPVSAGEPVDVQVTEVGWWTSRPGALPQPEGGFEVAATPTGDTQSLAALRVDIAASSVDDLQIRLDETASAGTQVGGLKLCATTSSWSAANPGSMDDAPVPDCSTSAVLTRTTDGVWLGDATALAPTGGEVTLVVVPLYTPPAPIGPGLIVAIGGGDLTATGSTTTPTTSPTGGPSPTFDPGPFDFPQDDAFAPVGGGSFGIPSTGLDSDFGTVNPEPAATVPPEQEEDTFALDPEPIDNEPPPPWIRLVLLVPLSAGFGVGTVRLRRLLDENGLLGA